MSGEQSIGSVAYATAACIPKNELRMFGETNAGVLRLQKLYVNVNSKLEERRHVRLVVAEGKAK